MPRPRRWGHIKTAETKAPEVSQHMQEAGIDSDQSLDIPSNAPAAAENHDAAEHEKLPEGEREQHTLQHGVESHQQSQRHQVAWEQHALSNKGHVAAARLLICSPAPQGGPVAIVVEPGLVLLKGALSGDLQLQLAEFAWNQGHHQGGFYDDTSSGPSLNSTRNRGRIYKSIGCFPAWLPEMCLSQVLRACRLDPGMPGMTPTHLLLLYYKSDRGLGWHRDDSENDGIGEEPVVSFSVGDACDFAVRHDHSEEARVLRLESGDVLLFGGPCRRILHTVAAVHPDTSPLSMPVPGRFNFTFRHAPNIVGREKEFEYFKPGLQNQKRKSK